jgi:geranylgeranylglycerol-phosphate geranylgeranyltransferase
MRGDRKLGLKTFPLCYGARKAAILAVAFLVAAMVVSPIPYVLGILSGWYLKLVIVAIAVFIWTSVEILRSQKLRVARRASLACKAGMGLGLIAFLVGMPGPI